jgi:hypothetical protein
MSKPTKTEKLLFGSKGASDARDPFRLERDLIPSEQWPKLYKSMPKKIQETVDWINSEDFDMMPTGIGYNKEVGWFILGCGQGPFVIWIENE